MAEKDENRPQFGSRYLENPEMVFQHNAWDNVEWDEEQEEEAKKKVANNSSNRVTTEKQKQFEADACKFWDSFYTQHQNRFFKDRHWLFTEFPELETPSELRDQAPAGSSLGLGEPSVTEPSQFPGCRSSFRILEVGCGVGNTVFPVLQSNNDPGLFIYCCDLSPTAIQLVKDHPDYDTSRCHAFVCDVSGDSVDLPFPNNSLDIIVLIFVLSAIHPDRFLPVILRLAACLKPGGQILFRDYGRYDLAQLRFKNGQCLSDNFYVRGDGTRVYFFTQDELRSLFTGAGLEEVQNLVDRRLQVNRGRQLKMYRVWIQCKYRKPTSAVK